MSAEKMRAALEAALLREDLGPELAQQMREAVEAGNGLESQPVTDSEIRRVFLAHGFVVKPGCDDLKPYVYAAGRALCKLAQAAQERKPLTPQQVKEILDEAGYDTAPAQSRADFINGLCHGELAHGITATSSGEAG